MHRVEGSDKARVRWWTVKKANLAPEVERYTIRIKKPTMVRDDRSRWWTIVSLAMNDEKQQPMLWAMKTTGVGCLCPSMQLIDRCCSYRSESMWRTRREIGRMGLVRSKVVFALVVQPSAKVRRRILRSVNAH